MQYFLSDEDKKAYGQLTGGGRRRFFINFWNSLDPNPNTYKNEFWVEYFKRIEYSNNHFTAGFKTGWKTDRGRIAIKFGIPDDRRQYSVTVNTRPYEEWHYYREEGKRFIFIDEEGTGQYRLIYSSDDTEFTDPDWQDLVGR
ncbi:GWxTD domain-containing protein [candidate division KSB1 bacterium]|nr:GWxTD domain-containing protein [candidate division KSB1 bacterium]